MRVSHPLKTPPVLGYLHHAFPLSVVLGRADGLPWLYSNYIQLSCPSTFDFRAQIEGRRRKFDFYLHPDYYAVHPNSHVRPSPLLESCWFDRDLALAEGGLVRFLIRAIDRGYCVEACADEYHVPGMACYQAQHRTHEILVSGYDLETSTFVVSIGFDRSGDYAVDEIEFGDIERAIGSADLTGHYNQLGIGLLRSAKQVRYELDVAWIVEQLDDYLEAMNTSRRFRALRTPDDQLYGVAVYAWLRRYFDFLVDHHDCYDIRPLHILWEHKKLMVDRARFLAARGFVDESVCDRVKGIADRVGAMRMMLLKARVTREMSLIERIGDGLGRVREEEVGVLMELRDGLDPRVRGGAAVASSRKIPLSLRRSA